MTLMKNLYNQKKTFYGGEKMRSEKKIIKKSIVICGKIEEAERDEDYEDTLFYNGYMHGLLWALKIIR
jgi:hypothetical protein